MSPLSIPSPPPEWRFFELGTWIHSWLPIFPADWPLPIHVYALAILVGIVVAIIVANARLTARGAEPWVVVDLALWGVAGGIIGARAWHVFTHPDDYFAGQEWWKAFAVWEGGVAIFGAILGGAFGVWIACRIIGLRFTAAADAIAPTLLLAQAFGRIGNYFNQELFGLPTDLPWGLEIDRPNPAIPVGIPEDAVFHPTFLYEILWNLAGFVILILIENRISWSTDSVSTGAGRTGIRKFLPFIPEFHRRDQWYWGKMVGLWAIWYGIGRVWFESIRLDPSETFLGIRSNVWGALAAIVVGLLILIVQTKNHPGIEPSVYKPGKEWRPDSELDSDEIYQDSDDPQGAVASQAPATSEATRP